MSFWSFHLGYGVLNYALTMFLWYLTMLKTFVLTMPVMTNCKPLAVSVLNVDCLLLHGVIKVCSEPHLFLFFYIVMIFIILCMNYRNWSSSCEVIPAFSWPHDEHEKVISQNNTSKCGTSTARWPFYLMKIDLCLLFFFSVAIWMKSLLLVFVLNLVVQMGDGGIFLFWQIYRENIFIQYRLLIFLSFWALILSCPSFLLVSFI